MERKKSLIIFILMGIMLLLIAVYVYMLFSKSFSSDNYGDAIHVSEHENLLLIANWNLQIFGDKKSANVSLMNTYAQIIRNYDIIFLQELRDSDSSSFYLLCSMLPDYECLISARAGRSSSKEQYGVISLKNLDVSLKDYTPDVLDRWERPPIMLELKKDNYSLQIYNIHIKPNDTTAELQNLELLINSESRGKNVVILGDLNADCSYAPDPVFIDWHWIVKDSDDTTATGSDCAYDRILMNDESFKEYYSYGIYANTSSAISDHYLVWVAVIPMDKNINYNTLII